MTTTDKTAILALFKLVKSQAESATNDLTAMVKEEFLITRNSVFTGESQEIASSELDRLHSMLNEIIDTFDTEDKEK